MLETPPNGVGGDGQSEPNSGSAGEDGASAQAAIDPRREPMFEEAQDEPLVRRER